MGFFSLFKKRKAEQSAQTADRGILIFENTSEVIRSETLLKKGAWRIRVMGPPPEIRTGCDLVIEFPLIEWLEILRALEAENISPLKVVPVSGPLLEPVNIFFTKDFGRFLMIRAANMKLTIEKETLTVVNISGGGCPDVPYLAAEMIGKRLDKAPSPRTIGHTLCGYALQLAYEEVSRQCLP
ncbi:MAG: DUF3343 domain-containing protein [Desulfobacteraceae bacterium]